MGQEPCSSTDTSLCFQQRCLWFKSNWCQDFKGCCGDVFFRLLSVHFSLYMKQVTYQKIEKYCLHPQSILAITRLATSCQINFFCVEILKAWYKCYYCSFTLPPNTCTRNSVSAISMSIKGKFKIFLTHSRVILWVGLGQVVL